jgi:hypothetical protein
MSRPSGVVAFPGERPPTVADRVVQASLKQVLEPIFEAGFLPCSYGFVRHEVHVIEGGERPLRRIVAAVWLKQGAA